MKTFLKILLGIFIGAILVGGGVVIYFFAITNSFLDEIKPPEYRTEKYYAVVNATSEYQTVADASGKGSFGVYEDRISMDNFNSAMDTFRAKGDFWTVTYDDYNAAAQALLKNEIVLTMLSSVSYATLTDEIENFEEQVRIVDTAEVQFKDEEASIIDVDITKEPFNIYVTGIDEGGRTDVNMIVTVNPQTHQILLTGIPRDLHVQIHGTTGLKDKLSHAGYYGPNVTIKTIEETLGVQINYYVRVHFESVVTLVDTIGGIEFYSDQYFTRSQGGESCTFYVGNNYADGNCALCFARTRKVYSNGDLHRVENQQTVMEAILNKMLSSEVIINKYAEILEDMSSVLETNVPSGRIYDFMKYEAFNRPEWSIEKYRIDGTALMTKIYSGGESDQFVYEPDMDTVNEAKNKIDTILNNKP